MPSLRSKNNSLECLTVSVSQFGFGCSLGVDEIPTRAVSDTRASRPLLFPEPLRGVLRTICRLMSNLVAFQNLTGRKTQLACLK